MIDELSPINFYLMNGKKELIPPEVMPNKYAYAFSQLHMSSPKMRIKFMEQLASHYVVNTNTLFNLYRLNVHEDKEKNSNASMAVIELDQAFNNDSEQKKLLALKEALKIFYKKNLITHLSNEYKNRSLLSGPRPEVSHRWNAEVRYCTDCEFIASTAC